MSIINQNSGIVYKPLVYVMRDIVQATSDVVLPKIKANTNVACQDLNYKFGTWSQIAAKLEQWGANPTLRNENYPLVVLLRNAEKVKQKGNDYQSIKMQMFIVCPTSLAEYGAFEQQFNNYDSVLYPIYLELLNQIAKSEWFCIKNPNREIQHQQIDDSILGVATRNGFSNSKLPTALDCIVLKNLTINAVNEVL
jgi:hypothetical protein